MRWDLFNSSRETVSPTLVSKRLIFKVVSFFISKAVLILVAPVVFLKDVNSGQY